MQRNKENVLKNVFKKTLAAFLSVCMVMGTLPAMVPEAYTAEAATQAELEGYGTHEYFIAKYPDMTELTSAESAAKTLSAGTYYVPEGQTVYFNCDSAGTSTPTE